MKPPIIDVTSATTDPSPFRRDDGAKCGADHHRDGQIHHIAAQDKRLVPSASSPSAVATE